MTIHQETLDAVALVMRERFAAMETEIRRTDRGLALTREVERLQISESIRAVRSFLHALVHEKSRLVEEHGDPPAWLALLDQEENGS